MLEGWVNPGVMMEAPKIPRMSILLNRVYDHQAKKVKGEVLILLVDRLWPRGIRKEDLPLDLWAKTWAPSTELRQQFHEGRVDFEAFRTAYRTEIEKNGKEIAEFIKKKHPSTLVLLYGLKDPVRNNAAVFKEVLEEWMV